MKKLLIIPLLFLANFVLAQTKYLVTNSEVTYQIKNVGITTSGSFGAVQNADISFDKQHIAASTIQATVDVKKLDSGSEMRDEHVKGPDFFDAGRYPTFSIKSVSLKAKSGNRYSGVFDLTIKGITKRLEIPFTCTENGNAATFTGSFKIKRSDYNIGTSTLTLADEATVTVNIQAAKAN